MYARSDQYSDMENLMAGTVYVESIGYPSFGDLFELATAPRALGPKHLTLAT